MTFSGKYRCTVGQLGSECEYTIVVRDALRGYEGEIIYPNGTSEILDNVHTANGRLVFQVPVLNGIYTLSLSPDNNIACPDAVSADGDTAPCTAEYTPVKRRALILYATMTKNTERIAKCFADTFRHYNWEVKMLHLKASLDWESLQDELYFDDYDVVCLGSPIVAGYPLNIIDKLFALGAGGQLEANVQKQIDAGGIFKAESGTMGGGPDGVTGAEGQPPVTGKRRIGVRWRRRTCPFPGGQLRDNYQPLGIVFTTFGGGFFGPDECKVTIAALKNFLALNDVRVIGTFACCGREFGPAGIAEGEKPKVMVPGKELPDPIYYELEDGTLAQGSYFFHYNNWTKPCSRDEAKASALIADIVEDYFMTYDGKRRPVLSEYISIS